MEGLQSGRVVDYVLPNGEVRPAIVVKVWSLGTGLVSLNVFVDENDGSETTPIWRTQVFYNEQGEPGTWHWPPKF